MTCSLVSQLTTTNNMNEKVSHVIVDSGGFIKNAPVAEIGQNIYTVEEVIREIRDKATRERLQVLPYDLKIKEPPTEALKIVSDFAKKTGDYRSLSAVDLKLMALVYQLEKEHVGADHLKTQADSKITWTTTKGTLENPTDIAGFYLSKKKSSTSRSASESQNSSVQETAHHMSEIQISDDGAPEQNTKTSSADDLTEESDVPTDTTCQEWTKRQPVKDGAVLPSSALQEAESDEESGSDGESTSDDDDEGWITPDNIAEVKAAMGEPKSERARVPVACLTTDFAIQNVLIQMGLNVVSVEGMLIKRAKSYVLRCHACFKITTNMMKEFCPCCGNKTLQKVSMTVDDDGSIRCCLSRRKAVSTRGLKFSLPMPRGGKHANNPILCEDQREAQQRGSKASRLKYDVLDPDYLANTSPFAPNDIYSRSAQLGIRAKHRDKRARNPNENKKNYGRRK